MRYPQDSPRRGSSPSRYLDPPPRREASPILKVEGDRAVVEIPTVGTFVVDADGTLEEDLDDEVHPRFVEAQRLGPLLGLQHNLRGRFVLHASAVSRDGRAHAFVGGRQWGKSTSATLLLDDGFDLVTDDILPIETPEDGDPLAHPGPERIKLWPDSARDLGYDPEDLDRLYPSTEKRVLEVPTVDAPLPLASVNILGGDGLETITPQDGMIELVRHTYRVRAFEEALPDDHFGICADVARSVDMRRVEGVPQAEDEGPDVAKLRDALLRAVRAAEKRT